MSSLTLNSKSNLPISEARLRESLSFVLRARDPKGKANITDLTRVNEQDMFAALTHGQLKEKDSLLAREFEGRFTELVQELIKKDPNNGIFEAARRAVRAMRRSGKLIKASANQIRKVSLGMAQLDTVRDRLSTKNVTTKNGDTALRAIKTAIAKFSANSEASVEDLKSFTAANGTRRAEQRAMLP